MYLPPERWKESDDYRRGVQLYNGDHPWDAHEVWERIWLAAGQVGDERQRQFLQGLIQCAAARVKADQGKRDACRKLSARGLARLREIHGQYMGLDVPAFVAAFAAWTDEGAGPAPRIHLVDPGD